MSYWKEPLPATPYYAVIFISTRSYQLEGYPEMDELTIRLATEMDGFIGYESINSDRKGIFISYWRDMKSIEEWRKHPVHLEAKKKGNSLWYDHYISQICKVEHAHEHRLNS
ncbi:MAG TPA: antibiotic biosynthesis monooxygenase [Flavobacteriales bacterium]|nr:hypothetical protein [Flavobacteriales bacterium]HRE96135.1 antibiotic biosynthesis monooxygenase [Flavobacteriales bacterium]HRJ36681.1 antibiotic biosynthesis monooxygenase [Flavobacteriales bacterium]HRJ37392.1 antibiotic biosynthesis monooxygenase [Flavobacteriales bacterium]